MLCGSDLLPVRMNIGPLPVFGQKHNIVLWDVVAYQAEVHIDLYFYFCTNSSIKLWQICESGTPAERRVVSPILVPYELS
jgi:hypothetical protein